MPKTKRTRDSDMSDDGSEDAARDLPKSKKAKNASASKSTSGSTSGKNGQGDAYWEVRLAIYDFVNIWSLTKPSTKLGAKNRRVTVSKFGYGKSEKTVRIDIREFYEKDGEQLPGKKVGQIELSERNTNSWI
jgi:hypothetical protein